MRHKDFKFLRDTVHEASEIIWQINALEVQLIKSLQKIEAIQAQRHIGYRSVSAFLEKGHGYDKPQADLFVAISRVIKECPELERTLLKKRIASSKIKKILGVINTDNQFYWIQKALELPVKTLDQEVKSVQKDKLRLRKLAKDQGGVMTRKPRPL